MYLLQSTLLLNLNLFLVYMTLYQAKKVKRSPIIEAMQILVDVGIYMSQSPFTTLFDWCSYLFYSQFSVRKFVDMNLSFLELE